MKRFIISLLLLGIFSFAYSENIFSLSAGAEIGETSFSKNTADYEIFNFQFKVGFDYKYLLSNGLMFGAQVSLLPELMIIGSPNKALNGTIVTTTGFGINFAPIIGYRFGKRHLIGLELLPVVVSATALSVDATLTTQRTDVTVQQSGNITKFATEIRGNFQFGNNLARHGFFVGIGFPWQIDLSSLTIQGYKTVFSDKFDCRGFFVEVGYKLSFVK